MVQAEKQLQERFVKFIDGITKLGTEGLVPTGTTIYFDDKIKVSFVDMEKAYGTAKKEPILFVKDENGNWIKMNVIKEDFYSHPQGEILAKELYNYLNKRPDVVEKLFQSNGIFSLFAKKAKKDVKITINDKNVYFPALRSGIEIFRKSPLSNKIVTAPFLFAIPKVAELVTSIWKKVKPNRVTNFMKEQYGIDFSLFQKALQKSSTKQFGLSR